MPLWLVDAPAAEYCVWVVEESVERGELDGIYAS